jgi:hypothetical protein
MDTARPEQAQRRGGSHSTEDLPVPPQQAEQVKGGGTANETTLKVRKAGGEQN